MSFFETLLLFPCLMLLFLKGNIFIYLLIVLTTLIVILLLKKLNIYIRGVLIFLLSMYFTFGYADYWDFLKKIVHTNIDSKVTEYTIQDFGDFLEYTIQRNNGYLEFYKETEYDYYIYYKHNLTNDVIIKNIMIDKKYIDFVKNYDFYFGKKIPQQCVAAIILKGYKPTKNPHSLYQFLNIDGKIDGSHKFFFKNTCLNGIL